jgi:hypothetical protein
MTQEIDFFIDEEILPDTIRPDTPEPIAEPQIEPEALPEIPVATVISEGIKTPVKKIKKIDGINWIFPLSTCEHGIIPTSGSGTCTCAIEAPELMSDDCCHTVPTQEDPMPRLCPKYQQKDLGKK